MSHSGDSKCFIELSTNSFFPINPDLHPIGSHDDSFKCINKIDAESENVIVPLDEFISYLQLVEENLLSNAEMLTPSTEHFVFYVLLGKVQHHLNKYFLIFAPIVGVVASKRMLLLQYTSDNNCTLYAKLNRQFNLKGINMMEITNHLCDFKVYLTTGKYAIISPSSVGKPNQAQQLSEYNRLTSNGRYTKHVYAEAPARHIRGNLQIHMTEQRAKEICDAVGRSKSNNKLRSVYHAEQTVNIIQLLDNNFSKQTRHSNETNLLEEQAVLVEGAFKRIVPADVFAKSFLTCKENCVPGGVGLGEACCLLALDTDFRIGDPLQYQTQIDGDISMDLDQFSAILIIEPKDRSRASLDDFMLQKVRLLLFYVYNNWDCPNSMLFEIKDVVKEKWTNSLNRTTQTQTTQRSVLFNPRHAHQKLYKRGTTYMQRKEREEYIGLPTEGATDEPFNLSVKGDRITAESIVTAVLKVATFLAGHQDSLFKNQYSYIELETFKKRYTEDATKLTGGISIQGGILVPLLTVLVLIYESESNQVSVALETYNGKRRGSYQISSVAKDEDFISLIERMNQIEHYKVTFVLMRFVEMLQKHNEWDTTDLKLTENDIKFGIGVMAKGRDIVDRDGKSHASFLVFNPIKLSKEYRNGDFKNLFANSKPGGETVSKPPHQPKSTPAHEIPRTGYDNGLKKRLWDQVELGAIEKVMKSLGKRPCANDRIDTFSKYIEMYKGDNGEFNWQGCQTIISNDDHLKQLFFKPHLSQPFSNSKKAFEYYLKEQFQNETGLSAVENEVDVITSKSNQNVAHITEEKQPIRVKHMLLSKIRRWFQMYHPFGFALPLLCRPITVVVPHLRKHYDAYKHEISSSKSMLDNHDLYRVQSYSVRIRTQAKHISNESSVMSSMLHLSDGSCHLNIATVGAKHEEHCRIIFKEIEEVRKQGETGRGELCFECKVENFRNTFLRSILFAYNAYKENTKCYSASTIAALAEFHAVVYSTMGEASLNMMINPNPETLDEYCDVWRTISPLMEHFFDGRILVNDTRIFMVRLMCMANRIVLKSSWKATWKSLRSISKFETDVETTMERINSWRQSMGIVGNEALTSSVRETMETLIKESDSTSGVFLKIISNARSTSSDSLLHCCTRCVKVFSKTNVLHPCLALFPESEMVSSSTSTRFCSVASPIFLDIVSKQFEKLQDQQRIVVSHIIQRQERNVFLTGGPGVGKSFVLKFLILALARFYMSPILLAVTATSNIAACLINGMTVHHFLYMNDCFDFNEKEMNKRGMYLNSFIDDYIAKILKDNGPEKRAKFSALQVLIIDEVQQLNADFFNFLDLFLKAIRMNHEKPFGGIRIIACGDVMQLPPVAKDSKHLKRTRCEFFFQDPSFNAGQFDVAYLTDSMRQSDKRYIEAINMVRTGTIDSKVLSYLNDPKEIGFLVPRTAVLICIEAGGKWLPTEARKRYVSNDRSDFAKWSNDSRLQYIVSNNPQSPLGKTIIVVTEHEQRRTMINTKLEFCKNLSKDHADFIDSDKVVQINSDDEIYLNQKQISISDFEGRYSAEFNKFQQIMEKELESNLQLYPNMMIDLACNASEYHKKRQLASLVSFAYHGNQDVKSLKLCSRLSPGDESWGAYFEVEKIEIKREFTFESNGNKYRMNWIRRQFPVFDSSVLLLHNIIGITIDVPCIYVNVRVSSSDKDFSKQAPKKTEQYGFLCTVCSRCRVPGNFLPLLELSIEEVTKVNSIAKDFDQSFAVSSKGGHCVTTYEESNHGEDDGDDDDIMYTYDD